MIIERFVALVRGATAPRAQRQQSVAVSIPLACIQQNTGGLEAGEWPDDPDATPEWMIRVEALQCELGKQLPYRTRREFDACLDRAHQRVTDQLFPQAELGPALSPVDAANGFLTHLRRQNRVIRMASETLSEAYLHWCAEEGIRPSGDNMLRAALIKLDGVTKEQINVRCGKAKRRRNFVWVVTPVSTETVAETAKERFLVAA